MLLDLHSGKWSEEMCDVMGIPLRTLPQVVPSSRRAAIATGVLEGVPISGVLGDQQAALFGQTCFKPGMAKNTYGTGCFLLLNTGTRAVTSSHGLLTTIAYQIDNEPLIYALEGSVAVTGSLVQWLRDNLGLIKTAAEVEDAGGLG